METAPLWPVGRLRLRCGATPSAFGDHPEGRSLAPAVVVQAGRGVDRLVGTEDTMVGERAGIDPRTVFERRSAGVHRVGHVVVVGDAQDLADADPMALRCPTGSGTMASTASQSGAGEGQGSVT